VAELAGSPAGPAGLDDDQYDAFLAAVRARFAAVCGALGKRPALFLTAAGDLFTRFLDALPPAMRQIQTCATCRAFFARHGALVRIEDDGNAISVLWDPAGVPEPYVAAVRALAKAVTEAPVERVFVSSEPSWGAPAKGPWSHLAVTPPGPLVFAGNGLKTAGQVAAERLEDRAILLRGLDELSPDVVKKAVALLKTDALYRSEKCLGVAEWLLEVHAQRKAARGDRRRDNVIWLAAATAPPGFCHVRSTMIGSLLEDLSSTMAFDTVKARFAAKMHPLQYQRPTAAPSAQNIARAEQIVAQLKSAGALDRRFAKLADIEAVWKPTPPAKPAKPGGVFSHLVPKPAPRGVTLDSPPTVMTWDKFSRTVLPDAARIEFLVPTAKQSYMALVTAQHPDPPPILQWDSAERRNPVSPYLYVNGSEPAHWNLKAGAHRPVTAITLAPAFWYGNQPTHHNQFALFILEDARDLQYKSGAGFFPEFLRSDYHEIRKTIEAYAKAALVDGRDDAEACGISLSKGSAWNHTFRVTSKDDVTQSYKLDRWD
jgi:hypothetical protein